MSVGYLFLVYDNLHPIWKLWFPQNNSVYVHSKLDLKDPHFSSKQIEQIDTQWGHISIVEAMILLLQNSILDTSITHFVFLSGNCIPIFNYHHTSNTISQIKKSSLHIFHKRNKKGINKAFENYFTRHSQWCILIRDDVETILSTSFTHLFYNITIPDENYFGTLLNFYDIKFDNIITTFVNWHKKVKHKSGKSPHTYKCITNDLVNNILQDNINVLFLRKVEHNFDLQYIHKFNTLLNINKIHTVTFSK